MKNGTREVLLSSSSYNANEIQSSFRTPETDVQVRGGTGRRSYQLGRISRPPTTSPPKNHYRRYIQKKIHNYEHGE